MKKITNILHIVIVAISMCACADELVPYNNPINRLGFEYDRNTYGQIDDSVKRFTFVYSKSSLLADTLWVEMRTVGFVTNYDRPFQLEQLTYSKNTQEELKQAVKDIHYVDFNDEKLKNMYYIPANKNSTLVPIVLKRDKSLLKNKYYLKIRVKENEHFSQSYSSNSSFVIELSDILTKPKYWNYMAEYYFAGKYGEVKHKFMIEASGEKINDDYFYAILGNPKTVDLGYTTYLSSFYSQKLREYNEDRRKKGLAELREKPTKNGLEGELVRFTLFGSIIN